MKIRLFTQKIDNFDNLKRMQKLRWDALIKRVGMQTIWHILFVNKLLLTFCHPNAPTRDSLYNHPYSHQLTFLYQSLEYQAYPVFLHNFYNACVHFCCFLPNVTRGRWKMTKMIRYYNYFSFIFPTIELLNLPLLNPLCIYHPMGISVKFRYMQSR